MSDALTIFILSVIVGYYVIWGVTPALHSPLMGITNAISSVIIVGALLAAGAFDMTAPLEHATHRETIVSLLGLVAIFLSSVNIFGGFIVTWRMLSMFRQKATPKKPRKSQ
ncbi:MAG: NAD(P) transhydrogenase subunit alpha [Alphaproteobacteria bacterium GM7ARS4]|nr:NAD(P) transhydrogenase subunit alpha [Alphaproteobacteria bacterium GM7ARS4]